MREPKKVRTRPELEKSCRMLREHNEKLKATIKRLKKENQFLKGEYTLQEYDALEQTNEQ